MARLVGIADGNPDFIKSFPLASKLGSGSGETTITRYDLILRNGNLYDGHGGHAFVGDLGIIGDRIAQVGGSIAASARLELDATNLAIAPGFINMLSWAVESLIYDGHSQSDIRQGVTLEVMGEGFSFGPFSEAMKAESIRGILGNEDIHYPIEWTTLGEYLEFLERRGVSCNIASFVGTSTLRIHQVGYDDRPPTSSELKGMQALIREAMEEGAVGLSSALIYPPASYAQTDELVALASIAAEYDGLYISHLRSEGDFFYEALEEFLAILRAAKIRGEIYHLKAKGLDNWGKMPEVVRRIEAARASGLAVTANMYPYEASGTGLSAIVPPWVHEGGNERLLERIADPALRPRIIAEMRQPASDWDNFWRSVGAENTLLGGFANASLKPLTGQWLSDVAAKRGKAAADTALDLLLEDGGHVFAMYFGISEKNIREQIRSLPWLSFCSDAESLAPEGPFLKSNPHPRAYGSFARLLGKYVRDESLLPLAQAIHRLTALPAKVLKIEERGILHPGYFADIVVFDPATISDHATYAQPHQFATGVHHVIVNGEMVLRNGEHTGAKPGRVVRGPGWHQRIRA